MYLSRALSIGEAPKFEAITREAAAVSDEDLARVALCIHRQSLISS